MVCAMQERGALLGHEIIAVGPPHLDLALGNDAMILASLAEAQPDAIVHAAAYTLVDRAEEERDLAFAINAHGAGAVARAAAQLAVPLVHISTDYVFAGDKVGAYLEDDATGPLGVYGASKLAGEAAVLAEVALGGADAVIMRTSWLYSPYGANFIKTMLRLADTRDEVPVVADQRGSPTSALDLADAVMAVLVNMQGNSAPELRGVFHCAGQAEASWADFAEAIFATSAGFGGPVARVNRITTAQYPTAAIRPANSVLDCTKLRRLHNITMPDWRISEANIVARLVADGQ